MKTEPLLLVWAVLLTFAQRLVAVMGATLQVGLPPRRSSARSAVWLVSVIGLAPIFSQLV